MAYNDNIPQPTDFLSNSQSDMLNNFKSANSSMAINHYPFNDGTVNNGKHKFIEMPQLTVAPTTVASEGALYTKAGTAGTALFWIRDGSAGTEVQLTSSSVGNVSNSSNGFTWLPGGIFMQWGQVASPGSSGSVSFPVSFNAAPYSIQVTLQRASGNQSVTVNSGTPPTTTGFNFLSSSGGSTILYWIAIGSRI